MMVPDRTCLNLLSLALSGTALSVILSRYHHPNTLKMFWDENLSSVRQAAVTKYGDRIFTTMALSGLVAQAVAEVYGGKLQDRLYTQASYIRFTLGAVAGAALLAWGLRKLTFLLARRKWAPLGARSAKGFIEKARETLANGGLEIQYNNEVNDWPSGQRERVTAENTKALLEPLRNLEELFELSGSGELHDRLGRLEVTIRPFLRD